MMEGLHKNDEVFLERITSSAILKVKVKVKVKQSRYRLGQALRVPGR
jgi:hypothetical protein